MGNAEVHEATDVPPQNPRFLYGLSWTYMGSPRLSLGSPWSLLGMPGFSRVSPGALWGSPGAVLVLSWAPGLSWALLGSFGAVLRLSCAPLGLSGGSPRLSLGSPGPLLNPPEVPRFSESGFLVFLSPPSEGF